MPVVSVILPTYNRGHLVARAIQSVLRQTFQDLEIIVVDDGSDDNTREVVLALADSKIRYIRLERNRGAAAARNRGIDVAQGELIAFQDSDDEWFREKLAKQMAVFEKASTDIGVVYTGEWRIRGDSKKYVPQKQEYKQEGYIHEEILNGNFVDLPTSVVKKECFSKVGVFDEALPCMQDWELWIRISKNYHFKYLAEPLVNAYYTSDSISIDYKNLAKAWEHVLNRHSDKFKGYRKLLSDKYIYLAHLVCSYGDMGKGRKFLLQALKAYPFNRDTVFFLLLSFLGQKIYGGYTERFWEIEK